MALSPGNSDDAPIGRIVVVDLWTDANSGDCALQEGLISMVRAKWPNATVYGIFRFGTNELDVAAPEIAHSTSLLDGVSGGVRRTYYSAANVNRFPHLIGKLVSLYSFLELALILIAAGLRFEWILPPSKRHVLRALRSADIVLWKGKNFRDYGGIGGIGRQLTLLSAGLVATLLNDNVHCVNASIWAMKSRVERHLVSRILSRCRSISVREPASLAAARAINISAQVFFAPDLSFYALKHCYGAYGQLAPHEKPYDVALTITKWGTKESQQHYLEILTTCLVRLAEQGASRIVIVPQVTRAAEDNGPLVEKLVRRFGGTNLQIENVGGSPDIGELLALYRRSRLLIGTRMHSCVFAMASGTPFVAVAYDAGPKWEILKQFWPASFLFEYVSSPTEVAAAAVALYLDPDKALYRASDRFRQLGDDSFTNVLNL